ncbi:MAG: dihydrofolate reductase family protein [Nitrososphaera sp.]
MRLTLSAAMTLDGKIATASGDSKISSAQDLKRVHRLRASSDAIIVGISTVLADDPLLTVRYVKGKNPLRVIVDSRGRIPAESKILQTSRNVSTVVAVTSLAPKRSLEKIRAAGAQVLVTPEGTPQSAAVPRGVDLRYLFNALDTQFGVERALVEGGGELNWSLLRLGLADELVVTIAPKVVGGRLATTLVEGDGAATVAQGLSLALEQVQRSRKTGEIIVRYSVLNTSSPG